MHSILSTELLRFLWFHFHLILALSQKFGSSQISQADTELEDWCGKRYLFKRSQCIPHLVRWCNWHQTRLRTEMCQVHGRMVSTTPLPSSPSTISHISKMPFEEPEIAERAIPKERLDRLKDGMRKRFDEFSKQKDLRRQNIPKFQRFQRDSRRLEQKTETEINDPDLFWNGDILLSDEQASYIESSLKEKSEFGNRFKRKVGTLPHFLWDSLPISFTFDETVRSNTRKVVGEALTMWETNTCVRFLENGTGTDRIVFKSLNFGCSSFVGKLGGTQVVNLQYPGCSNTGIVSHEVGHALGFFHEQGRPDQEENISVDYENVHSDRWNNFLPQESMFIAARSPNHFSSEYVSYYDQPYDLGSVMHYSAYSFALNRDQPSIVPIDPRFQHTLGQRTGPSFIDFAQVNAAYCSEVCPPSTRCKNGGYPDPNDCSKCKCPPGLGGSTCRNREPSLCGQTLIAYPHNKIDLETPEHPNYLGPNLECNWLIKTTRNRRIGFEFVGTDFGFECKEVCDTNYVEIKTGPDFRKTGFRFCCDDKPNGTFMSYDSSMAIIVRTGPDSANRGFKGRFWQLDTEPEGSGFSSTSQPVFTKETTTLTPPTRAPSTKTTRNPGGIELITGTIRVIPTILTDEPTTAVRTTPRPDCRCEEWTRWSDCTQACGGCGTISRRRCASFTPIHRLFGRQTTFGALFLRRGEVGSETWRGCNRADCYDLEKRRCNYRRCDGTNVLVSNAEFHLLFDGCCLGMINNNRGKCGGLETFVTELFSSLIPSLQPLIRRLHPNDYPYRK